MIVRTHSSNNSNNNNNNIIIINNNKQFIGHCNAVKVTTRVPMAHMLLSHC